MNVYLTKNFAQIFHTELTLHSTQQHGYKKKKLYRLRKFYAMSLINYFKKSSTSWHSSFVPPKCLTGGHGYPANIRRRYLQNSVPDREGGVCGWIDPLVSIIIYRV